MSGLDYYRPTDTYVAISDNRGEEGPIRAYTLKVPLDRAGKPAQPHFQRLIRLRDTNGQLYAPRTADTESIPWTPNHHGFVYTSEGEAKVGRAGFIRQSDLHGNVVRDFPIPKAYAPRLGTANTPVSVIRDNLGFESMSLGQGGATIAALSENALVQDGPSASVDSSSPARLLKIDRATGANLGEFIYPVDRVAPGALPVATGASEMLTVDHDTFLTLERSLIPDKGFTAKIYQTSTTGGDNVAGAASIPKTATPTTKELIFDFGPTSMSASSIVARQLQESPPWHGSPTIGAWQLPSAIERCRVPTNLRMQEVSRKKPTSGASRQRRREDSHFR
ncbi:esterase-like activity of phytase family protein [Gordonia sp. SL306]|uniref:esterase-like activity of phytase family protein n=1 Tax=Gordonia sp. SL306 TaxID=2995145 RepID=UPI00226EE4D7|nr:esterase-like activity of phytase family protein [Gordonia sp. SL306]WAC58291.1 esterase-like activity of phytase family protein [Gordonia sp. SL306]